MSRINRLQRSKITLKLRKILDEEEWKDSIFQKTELLKIAFSSSFTDKHRLKPSGTTHASSHPPHPPQYLPVSKDLKLCLQTHLLYSVISHKAICTPVKALAMNNLIFARSCRILFCYATMSSQLTFFC